MVVNKLDKFEVEKTYDFYSLGLGEPFPISCAQSKGLGEVLDAVVSYFPNKYDLEEENKVIKIAVNCITSCSCDIWNQNPFFT